MIMEQPVDTLVTQSIARVRKAQRPRKQRSKGLLVAEGDSWFDYFSYDILRKLEHYGFDIRCVANHGDKLRDMARLETQHDKLASVLERLNRQNRVPKAVLVSAGGNDLAEECVLRTLLNDASWGGPILNEEAVRGFINVRLRKNYLLLLEFITALCVRIFGDGTRIPIVIHGYGHPVPDGRGVGFFNEPGPWLEPEFKARCHGDVAKNTAAMMDLIDRFNDMLVALPEEDGLGHVQYVDLRRCLKNTLENNRYEKYWGNEMHPTARGFGAIAREIMSKAGLTARKGARKKKRSRSSR